jgi:hypothetical protein
VTLNHVGSISHSDLVSVDFTDVNRQTMLAGGHETPNVLRRTINAGGVWTDIGNNIPSGAGYSAYPVVIDANTHLLGTYAPNGSGTAPGVYRTINGGTSWTLVFAGGVFGHPLAASDGSYYWLLDAGAGLIRSLDKGVTWNKVAGSNIFAASISGVVELPDGRLATPDNKQTGHLLISSDHGATWTQIGSAMPYSSVGLVYSKFRKAFYIWHFDCTSFDAHGDPVLADAIERLDFDYTTQ